MGDPSRGLYVVVVPSTSPLTLARILSKLPPIPIIIIGIVVIVQGVAQGNPPLASMPVPNPLPARIQRQTLPQGAPHWLIGRSTAQETAVECTSAHECSANTGKRSPGQARALAEGFLQHVAIAL